MTLARETLTNLLKQHGYSVTQARIAVFNALLGQEPMSMSQLVKKAADIDRASVYRAVDLFERLGIIQRLNTGWKYKIELTDKFTEHHHHLTCIQCGQTTTINEQSLEHFIDQLACTHGFRPTAHQIEIQGVCAPCQQDKRAKRAPARP
ncbi:MAG TPA: Fur family transcriptional regulator [Candidatus Saccharimonadales bacterium]|nr:Fur family transcriptional regulator [Candidatus Saccharimonadales bacterium]